MHSPSGQRMGCCASAGVLMSRHHGLVRKWSLVAADRSTFTMSSSPLESLVRCRSSRPRSAARGTSSRPQIQSAGADIHRCHPVWFLRRLWNARNWVYARAAEPVRGAIQHGRMADGYAAALRLGTKTCLNLTRCPLDSVLVRWAFLVLLCSGASRSRHVGSAVLDIA